MIGNGDMIAKTDVSPRGATGMQGNTQHYDSENGAMQHSVWEEAQKLTMTNETAVQLPCCGITGKTK